MNSLSRPTRSWRPALTGVVAVLSCLATLAGCGQEAENRSAEVDQVTNLANPRAMAGIADAIFIGIVEKEVGNETRGKLPETQYSVKVSRKFKGSLQDQVTVNQFTGRRPDGSLFTIEGDKPLQAGKEYLFAALTHPNDQWLTVIDVYGTREIDSAGRHQELTDTFRKAVTDPLRPDQVWRRQPTQ